MSGSIEGQVVDQRNGQPLESATCVLTPSGGTKATDAKGSFAYPDLQAGTSYELVVSKEGYDSGIYGPLVVVDGAVTKLPLALQPKMI